MAEHRRWQEFAAVFIWEGIKILAGLGFATAAVYVVVRGPEVISLLQNHGLRIGLLFGAIGAAILIRSYYALRYHAMPKQQYDFEQLERAISFTYEDDSHFKYRKRIKLRALRRGLSAYPDKYKWTGDTAPTIANAMRGQTFRLTERKSVWQFYEIQFGRTLNKGGVTDTDLIFNFVDPQHSFVPFISTNIEEPTNSLKLSLTIPLKFGITEAISEISSSLGARVPFHTETLLADRDGCVEWVIPEPKMHHCYELRWSRPAIASSGSAGSASGTKASFT